MNTPRVRARRGSLLTNRKLLDDILVPVFVFASQIIQEAAAAANQGQEASTAGMVFVMSLQMGCKSFDAMRQNRNLHLGRPGVPVAASVFLNQFRFLFSRD